MDWRIASSRYNGVPVVVRWYLKRWALASRANASRRSHFMTKGVCVCV
jgi:hypothetical protein